MTFGAQRPSHNLTGHVLVARMGGSGPALPARGPALASAQLEAALGEAASARAGIGTMRDTRR